MKIVEAERLVDAFLEGRIKHFKEEIGTSTAQCVKIGSLRAIIEMELADGRNMTMEDRLREFIARDNAE